MFIGRENEIRQLKDAIGGEKKTAVLVYGKRRVGKSTLIKEAAGDFDGVVVNHMCIQSNYEGNIALLGRSICDAMNLPEIQFKDLNGIFDFLESTDKKILLILDEYQYLKNSKRGNEIDSLMQDIVDHMSSNIKLVLCGSYISIMRELLEEGNPLFGRFTSIIHLTEFDYYNAAQFYEKDSLREKMENYAIWGGSPYVLNEISNDKSLKDNIVELLLKDTGILRTYVENIVLREIQKNFDIRILEVLGNGKKKYSEIASVLGDNKGLLDKQLKNLIEMETIHKVSPINKRDDKKKQFYTINDNLIRFYFTYIFGYAGVISRIGEENFYERYIAGSIDEFISRRFENICSQYLERQTKEGILQDVYDIGSYWYDDPKMKTNGEFDLVVKKKCGYDFYECKFHKKPMTIAECRKEEEQVRKIENFPVEKICFVSLEGFDFENDIYGLISGAELLRD